MSGFRGYYGLQCRVAPIGCTVCDVGLLGKGLLFFGVGLLG